MWARMRLWGRARLQPARRACKPGCGLLPGGSPSPSPLSGGRGRRVLGRGPLGSPAADRGSSRPRATPPTARKGATPSSAGGGPDVWGMMGGTQGPDPHRLEKGPGPPPPRVPKLAPGGRRAQWGWQLRARRGSRGPALCGGGSLTRARRHPGDSAGVTGPSRVGPVPGAPPARRHRRWPRPQRAQSEGASGWSLAGTPQQGSASPTRPRSGRQCLDWGTVFPGAGRGQSRPPGLLGSPVPVWRHVPSGTSLEVAGRHRQEARRVAGPTRRAPWARSHVRSCCDGVWGPRLRPGGAAPVFLLPGAGARLGGLGCVGGVTGGGPLSLSFQ